MGVRFNYATKEQMVDMFRQFYGCSQKNAAATDAHSPPLSPQLEKHAEAFAAAITKLDLDVTTAALQHYFVSMRKKSMAEAVAQVHQLAKDIEEKASQEAEAKAAKKKKKKKKRNK